MEERLYLTARIAHLSGAVAPRLSDVVGRDAAIPFEEIRDRLAAKVINSIEWRSAAVRRYIDFRTFGILSDSEIDTMDLEPKTMEMSRICAGPEAKRFPQFQLGAKKLLIVSLNNRAKDLDLLEAAEEALSRSLELEDEEDYANDIHAHYISAYACWQAARLTPQSDSFTGTDRSRRAWSLAGTALRLASEQKNQHYRVMMGDLLNLIEADFPELAVSREATDAAAENGSKLPPDSSLMN